MPNAITRERLNKIFGFRNDDDEFVEGEIDSKWEGDNAFQGLQIISKYFDISKTEILVSAEHDIIYSVGTDELIEAGLTDEDAVALARLNWMADAEESERFGCFV